MLRIIFSLIVVSVSSFATNYAAFGDRLPIYTIGDASPMADALNFVAMLASSPAIKGIMLAGLIISTIRLAGNLAKNDGKGTLLEVGYSIFILIFFLLPTSNVSVVDARVAHGGASAPDVNSSSQIGYISYKAIDNIPLGLASIASFSTVVNWDLASLVDNVIAPVGGVDNKYLGVTQAGISTPANDLKWLVKNIANGVGKGKNPADYEYMFHEYVRVCAFPTVSLDMRYAQKIMKPKDGNYMTSLSPDSIPVEGTSIFDPISKTTVDCKDYWEDNLADASDTFEGNILEQFRNYKKYDANGVNTDYEVGLRNLINGTTTSEIASFKDSISALKRASIVASAVDSASTGLPGIDMSNRMSMTGAKQSIMIQGAGQFAWLGEVLPLAINIGFAFLIITGFLMSMFLLFQGWEKGLKVILNFAAGFFALGFSYVSLAITQGVVNRRAWAHAVEQYVSQGSPLQVTNYDFLLEQAATMDGLTGILGTIFVAAGSAIVFYGESKYIINGLMNKVASSYSGNNLEHTEEDNAKDTALAESMMERQRNHKMAKRLAEAGIPVDGGNIEFEYQRLQNELSAIGSARGAHDALSGSDAMTARTNTIVGAEAQSFEKSVQLQGYGAEVQNEGLEKSLDRIHSSAFTKGRGSAASVMREGDRLNTKAEQDAYVEGAARSAATKIEQMKGIGKAIHKKGMEDYYDNIQKESTASFLAKGIKAEAMAEHGLSSNKRMLDGDYAEAIYRGEASNIESTKMKSRVNEDREDYIKNNAANAFRQEMDSQSSGFLVRNRFGDNLMGLVSSVPYAGAKIPEESHNKNNQIPTTSDLALSIANGKDVKNLVDNKDVIKTPMEEETAKMIKQLESSSTPESVFTQNKDKVDTKSNTSGRVNNDIGLPFNKEATPEEKRLMAESGLSLEDVRKNKNSIVAHESSGNIDKRLHAENDLGYIGMAQFGAAALADVGLVDKDKYLAATHKTKHGRAWNKGINQKSFLADDNNWTIPGGKSAFMGSFSMQDDALSKLMTMNAKTLKRAGVDLGDSSHTKGLLMASHLGGAGNAINYAKYGRGFRDANGTSIGAYYNAGANDITKGYGGTLNSSGGGVRNTNTGSMSMKQISMAHARKSLDEWIASGEAIENTYQQDPSAYATAAAFREAGTLMTSQSIEGKGGLKAAINQGMMSAASEGSAEKAAFVGKTTQQLVSQGMNPNDAKKMAESIANGSERGAEKFKQAIMAASASSAKTNAAEQEGMSQIHSKNLRDEFGETLTEKTSKASGKTFAQEQKVISDDTQQQKQNNWEKRKKALAQQKEHLSKYAKSDNDVAANHVQSVLNNIIDKDPSLNNDGRKLAKQKASLLAKHIKSGDDVTTKDIKNLYGDKFGERAITALENNGVVFEDADGWGTGDVIVASKTGKNLKKQMANAVIVGALQEQDNINLQQLQEGKISQNEYKERKKKLDYLKLGASGKNGGDMPLEYFKDAGFTQEALDKFGIKKGQTKYANGASRMFQRHIDNDAVLGAAVANLDEEINKEMPKETPKPKKHTKPTEVKNESQAHSWNELANAQEGKKIKEFIGSGSGIIENTAKNKDIYSENAMYGELSKASTTQAKLQAQGGIHKAVSIDSAESSIKAATQKGAVTEQAAQLAGGGEGGKKIADAIKNASADGADLMAAGIIRAAQNLGAAQSGAKTASDMEAVSAHGGKEQYIADKVSASTFKETSEAKQAQIYDDQEMMNKRVAGYLKNYGGAAKEERVQNLIEQGILEEGSTGDNFQATTGKKARRAWAEAGAGAMNRDTNVMLSGERVNLSQDMATGETLANIDGSTREVQGHSYDTNAAWRVAEKLFPDDVEAQKAYVEGQQMSKEVSRNWGTGALSAASVKILNSMGIEPTDENRETMQDVIMGMGGVTVAATGAGITEAKQRYSNAKNGKFTAKEDFTYTDSNGKSREVKAGTNLDIPKDELEHFNENYDDKVSGRKGKVGQALDSMTDYLNKKSFNPLSSSTHNESIDSSNGEQDNEKPNKSSDEPKHDDSLKNNLDSDTSLPNGNDDYNTKNFKNQTNLKNLPNGSDLDKPNMRKGFVDKGFVKKSGGTLAGILFAEGISRAATGEGVIAPMVDSISEKAEDGKYFGEGGVSSVVGGVFIGEENYNEAIREGKKGNYGSLVGITAGGFVDNVVNGFGFLGTAAFSAIETFVGDESFQTNMQQNMLPQSHIADFFKSDTDGSRVQQIQQMNQSIQPMSDYQAGVSYVQSVTPKENRPMITQAIQNGSLTQEQMMSAGTPSDIVAQMPVNDNGTVDIETSGSMYKQGMANLDGVTRMPNNPTFKYSNNLGNSLNSGNISPVAASNIVAQETDQQNMNMQTDTQVQPVPAQTVVQTVVQEKVVNSMGGTDSITLQSGGANEVTEFAKNATSPGNVQTSTSDLKKSIDEVGLAMENMRNYSGNVAPEQVALNSLALGDLASGMAVATPVQTAGGELTIGSQNGYMTLGEGPNAIQTPVTSDFIKNAPPESIDRLASTFSNSRLNNEMIKTMSDDDVYGGMAGMASTNEMMYEMNTLARTGSIDTRLQNEDQVALLEDLVNGIDKMNIAITPEDDRKVG